jgi:hypothetical protein
MGGKGGAHGVTLLILADTDAIHDHENHGTLRAVI